MVFLEDRQIGNKGYMGRVLSYGGSLLLLKCGLKNRKVSNSVPAYDILLCKEIGISNLILKDIEKYYLLRRILANINRNLNANRAAGGFSNVYISNYFKLLANAPAPIVIPRGQHCQCISRPSKGLKYFDGVMTKRRKRHSQHFTGEINDPDFVL
ncbi:hypothetical protein NQ317_012242 [Molorchus minor]|uniref:Uncharacterized protein n=1 Tax=Molorchus minor TaxID=1323400 RepID=A0ABQ9K122_9CUCU|nr:hypothetical protein NQ317_012242 [Molorchus minor]